MAIQVRRGQYSDLQTRRLVQGEPFVTLDKYDGDYYVGMAVDPATNQIVRLATWNNLQTIREDCEQYAEEAKEYMEQATYIHIMYSQNADGTDFVQNPTTLTYYIGIYEGDSATAPTSKTDYKWFKWKGEQGQKGDRGDAGNAGAWVFETEAEWNSFDKTRLDNDDTIIFLWDMSNDNPEYMTIANYVGNDATGTVHNSDLLNGHNSSYFTDMITQVASTKANANNVYTKAEVNTELGKKASNTDLTALANRVLALETAFANKTLVSANLVGETLNLTSFEVS